MPIANCLMVHLKISPTMTRKMAEKKPAALPQRVSGVACQIFNWPGQLLIWI